MAKALRKNTICPTGATSPSWRTSADMKANSSAEISFRPMALNGCIASSTIHPFIPAPLLPVSLLNLYELRRATENPAQVGHFRHAGCFLAQAFVFVRPLREDH